MLEAHGLAEQTWHKDFDEEDSTNWILGQPINDNQPHHLALVRNDTLDDRPVHVVRLRQGDFPSRTYWIDAEHGDVLQLKQIAVEGSIRIPVTVTLSDFEELDGIRTAMRSETANPMSGRMVMTIEKIESGLELDDDVFTLEDPDATKSAGD